MFVHQTEIHSKGYRSLQEFEIIQQSGGRRKAKDVTWPNGDYVKGNQRVVKWSSGYGDDVRGDHKNFDDSNAGLSWSKQLCQNVCQLFMKQIALDIKIKFEHVEDSKIFDSYLSINIFVIF